jgi:hypothetical protein
MSEANGPNSVVAVQPHPRRFSWPMRVFLSVLLFDIIFRSLSVLFPVSDWVSELEMDALPWRLPTRAEVNELAAREPAPGRPAPLGERFLESLDDVWLYLKPWPSAKTRARLDSWPQRGKFVYCWLCTRCEFLEALTGADEEWPMFSPNVSKGKSLVRSHLVYADGSSRVVRLTADPEDLTRYAHWNRDKVLNYEGRVGTDADNRWGYCNLLSHRYAVNDHGSPLHKIYLYRVHYTYPAPGEDAAAHLKKQMEGSAGQEPEPAWEYDVENRQLRECAR